MSSVDYSTPPQPQGWLSDEENATAIAFAQVAERKFKAEDEPGHLLIVHVHIEPTMTVVAVTGVAKAMLDEFMKTIPPLETT